MMLAAHGLRYGLMILLTGRPEVAVANRLTFTGRCRSSRHADMAKQPANVRRRDDWIFDVTQLSGCYRLNRQFQCQ
jgi:hypothetical protein